MNTLLQVTWGCHCESKSRPEMVRLCDLHLCAKRSYFGKKKPIRVFCKRDRRWQLNWDRRKYTGVGQSELWKDGVCWDEEESQWNGKEVEPIETGILDSLRARDHPRDAAWVQWWKESRALHPRGPLFNQGPWGETLAAYGPLAAASHCHANERGSGCEWRG